MNAISVMIIIAALLFGRRLVQITKHFSNEQGNVEIALRLPATFYIKQGVGLLLVAIFLVALDPVPAGIAIAAAVGLTFNLFISIMWYSIQAQKKTEKPVSA